MYVYIYIYIYIYTCMYTQVLLLLACYQEPTGSNGCKPAVHLAVVWLFSVSTG